jgi:DNA-binding NarL/FixJ family response regulator
MPKTVLIADDSSNVRRQVKTLLAQRTDVTVCGEAIDGLEVVEKAKALKPDLVLLDLAMPMMNGAEAASVLKKSMPEITIIMFTMYGEDIGRYLTSVVGVDSVLSKPDGMTALANAVDTVLAKSSERHLQKKLD